MTGDFGLELIRDGSYVPDAYVPPAVADRDRFAAVDLRPELIDASTDPRAPGYTGPTAADRERLGKAYAAALEVVAAAQLAFDSSRSAYQSSVSDITIASRREPAKIGECQQAARDRMTAMLEAQDALRIARAGAEEARVALHYAVGLGMFA